MSEWTQVIGAIEVDTFGRSDAQAMYIVQTVVNHLPRIRGSEGDVEFFTNRLSRYSSSSNVDEFGQRSNLYTSFNPFRGHYGIFETQERVLITLRGSLRDTTFKETLLQTTKVLSRLASRLYVVSCVVSVSSYDRSFVFNNPQWIHDMDITDWTNKIWR